VEIFSFVFLPQQTQTSEPKESRLRKVCKRRPMRSKRTGDMVIMYSS